MPKLKISNESPLPPLVYGKDLPGLRCIRKKVAQSLLF